MSKNLNCAVVDGNLTKDVELNPNGTVGRFTIAVNESQKDPATGNYADYANFIDCKIFGKSAANLGKYLTKGKRVIVRGKLHQDRWEKDGQKQARLVVNVDEVFFAGGGQSQGQGGGQKESGGEFSEDFPF